MQVVFGDYLVLLLVLWLLCFISDWHQSSDMGRKRKVTALDSGSEFATPLDYHGLARSGELFLDKRCRGNHSFEEQSSASHNITTPSEHPAIGRSGTVIRPLCGRPLEGQYGGSDKHDNNENALEQNESDIRAGKRKLVFGGTSQHFSERRQFFEDPDIFKKDLGDCETIAVLHHLGDGCSCTSNPAHGSTETTSPFQDFRNRGDVDEDESGVVEEDSSDDEDFRTVVSDSGDAVFGQASYQKRHEGVVVDYDDSGDDVYVCSHCAAFFWSSEALKKKVKNQLTYTHCCEKGKVHLPLSYPLHIFLMNY